MATNQFTLKRDRYIPRHMSTANGVHGRIWEHRRLIDSAWVYYGAAHLPHTATRKQIADHFDRI